MESEPSLPGTLETLGKGQLLNHLQASISRARQSIWIVGPWLDAYFVGKIIDSLSIPEVEVYFIVRVDGEGVIDSKTLSALNLARKNLDYFQARSLPKLHSKIILIDKEVFYLGSTNWYWYSLYESLELSVTGKTLILPRLTAEIESYWNEATPIKNSYIKRYHDLDPITMDYPR
jgi:phosphatidylserine/phosphatidylglycerophosphate/cardiolipin synthase-like enzyme